MRKLLSLSAIGVAILAISGCTSDADTASTNIATAAEKFEVQREIVGINGITGETTLYVEGRCSFEVTDRRFDVTCKHGPDEFRKHTFVLGDQDSISVTQEKPIDVSEYHTRIVLKPQSIIPDFDIEVGK